MKDDKQVKVENLSSENRVFDISCRTVPVKVLRKSDQKYNSELFLLDSLNFHFQYLPAHFHEIIVFFQEPLQNQ